MTGDQLLEALALGEQRHLEFKADGSLVDALYRARVIRAVIGMANRRDGGTVILGVDDSDPPSSCGMSTANVIAWTHFDNVADQLSAYADPGITFVIAKVQAARGTFVILKVDPFRDIPVICKKAYEKTGGDKVLRRGALYVRASEGKIETREVDNVTEMRTLIDLASEKRLQLHIQMTARAGGVIAPRVPPTGATPDRFAAELGDLA